MMQPANMAYMGMQAGAVPSVSNGGSTQPPVMYTAMPQYQTQWDKMNSDSQHTNSTTTSTIKRIKRWIHKTNGKNEDLKKAKMI